MEIDLKIVMDHNIPEAHDFPPRDFRMGAPEFLGNTLSRFTEHRTLKQHSVLIPKVVEEIRFLQPTRVLVYLLRSLKHVSRSESSRCIHGFHVGENMFAPDVIAAFLN